MRRLDPIQLGEFFKTYRDISPTRNRFVALDENRTMRRIAGCDGITGMLISQGPTDFDIAGLKQEALSFALVKIAKALRLDYDYAAGFVAGWDGTGMNWADGKVFGAGYEDGKAAYKTVMMAI